jgi:hypothetical protein
VLGRGRRRVPRIIENVAAGTGGNDRVHAGGCGEACGNGQRCRRKARDIRAARA